MIARHHLSGHIQGFVLDRRLLRPSRFRLVTQLPAICKTRKLPLLRATPRTHVCKHVPSIVAKVKLNLEVLALIGVQIGSPLVWRVLVTFSDLLEIDKTLHSAAQAPLSYEEKTSYSLFCRLLLSWISNRCLLCQFRMYKKRRNWRFCDVNRGIDFPAKGLIKGSCHRTLSF